MWQSQLRTWIFGLYLGSISSIVGCKESDMTWRLNNNKKKKMGARLGQLEFILPLAMVIGLGIGT